MKAKFYFLALIVLLSVMSVLGGCASGSSQPESSAQPPAAESQGEGTGQEPEPNNEPAGPLKLTLVGGSAGGFWSLVGEGVGNILREGISGSQFSYETGNGVKNVIDVTAGSIPLGIAHNFEVKAGISGEPPFKEQVPNVTALVTLYNNAGLQVVVSKDFADKYGITSMEDIAEKKPPIRAAVNQRGNLNETVNRLMFEAYGFTYDDIQAWGGEVFYEPYKTGADMMKDNKVDLVSVFAFAPDGKFLELATTKEILLFSVNEEVQQALKESMGILPGQIPANSYEWLANDVPTVNASAMIVADPNMSEEEAYTVTKTLVENIAKIQALHKNLEILTPEIMADVSPAAMHPGAEKYFKEAGILK